MCPGENHLASLSLIFLICKMETKIWLILPLSGGFPGIAVVKNLPAMEEMQEMQVWSLAREDPLEKEMQHSPVFLSRGSHGQKSLVGYSPWGSKDSDMTEQLNTHVHAPITGKLSRFWIQNDPDCWSILIREIPRSEIIWSRGVEIYYMLIN